MRSVRKQIAKEAYANRVNPNPNRQAYTQPLRPRSTVFKSKKDYNRQTAKQECRKAVANW